MLVKANLLNGKSKIMAIDEYEWGKITQRIQHDANKYADIYMIGPVNYMNASMIYLNSKGIESIETLSYEEEKEIVNKINSAKSVEVNKSMDMEMGKVYICPENSTKGKVTLRVPISEDRCLELKGCVLQDIDMVLQSNYK